MHGSYIWGASVPEKLWIFIFDIWIWTFQSSFVFSRGCPFLLLQLVFWINVRQQSHRKIMNWMRGKMFGDRCQFAKDRGYWRVLGRADTDWMACQLKWSILWLKNVKENTTFIYRLVHACRNAMEAKISLQNWGKL